MRYLFLCNIGPVQDFIATARRSRDLWYGSWMLSELAKAVALGIASQEGLDALIFPAPEDLGRLGDIQYSVANKVVALIKTSPKNIEKLLQDKIASRLQMLKTDAYENIHGDFKRDLADLQIADLVEKYWVAIPCETDAEYPSARAAGEALLAARKNTRNFNPFPGAALPKSSLDGGRECVIPVSAYPKNGNDLTREQKIKDLYRHYHARPGERLSGVDLLKRLGMLKSELDTSFPSTSHMAALPFINGVGPEKYETLRALISNAFASEGWDIPETDGALLYESRISDWIPAGTVQDRLRLSLVKALNDQVGSLRPSPYYALFVADGDGMGKIIDAQTDPKTHQTLSQKLSKFAVDVPLVIQKHEGRAIYCGGDDILAYLPLHTALACATELEDDFRKKMKEFKTDLAEPTLSAGLVIAHHLTPLSEVLEMLRAAEKIAKNKVAGKNGLAITLDKRSGPTRLIYDKWKLLNERLDLMIGFVVKNMISKGAAYELQEIKHTLGQTGIPAKGIADEALRVINRKNESGGGKKITDDVKAAFEKWLVNDGIQPDEIAQELIIAALFADAQALAGNSVTEKVQRATAA
ncbi:MAG: type III-B CRISPR-associated protein Cas10/Cmr2 [Chloroflexi bacterium HGW-Chloroflexi-6]|nr:MAG: type III-B CRISPR-associated protein Cas10/Cmr2 [Chloroflexi bacterium HGW-Chloroflexi-6]